MSYTYLQGPGAESSAECFSDIEPFVRSKLNLTAEKSCCNGSVTESCPGSRSGTTSGHLTEILGEASLMSSAGDSPVRTSALPEKAQESTANAPDSGPKWPESLAKLDPATSLWRTRQRSFLEDLGECLETFPKWGMTRGGELFPLPMPVLRTSENESGYWPTPGAAKANQDVNLTCSGDGRSKPNKLGWAVAQWPTPTRSDATDGPGCSGRGGGLNLRTAIGNQSRSRSTATTTETVLFADSNTAKSVSVRARLKTESNTKNGTESSTDDHSPEFFPTPKSRDWKGQSQRGIHGPMDSLANLDRGDGKTIGGSLNPSWVEWLMNWPIKWSEANAIDIENFKRWQEASATTLSDSDGVRIVWWDRDPSATPQGPRHFQQQSGEHCDALQQVSRETACGRTMERTHENADLHELREFIQVQEGEGNDMQQGVRKSLGVDFPEVIPRVTTKTPNRTDRLKAIGNGQVPSVAALAWRILSNL